MSASYEVKKMIMDSNYKNQCCRRALLQGILASKATVAEERKILITFEKEEQIFFFGNLIREFYNKELEFVKLQ